jgi:magnesium transporter
MQLHSYQLNEDGALVPLSSAPPSMAWLQDDVLRWVDIEDATSDEVRKLLAPFELSPLIVDHFVACERTVNIVPFDQALFINLPQPAVSSAFRQVYLPMLCCPTTLITLHDDSVVGFATLMDKLRSDLHLNITSIPALIFYLTYELFQADARHYMELRSTVEQLAQTIDATPDELEVDTIMEMKHKTLRLANICEDLIFIHQALVTQDVSAFPIGAMRDAYRNRVTAIQNFQRGILRLESLLENLHHHYQLTLQETTNNRLRLLTVLSAVFLPLTLLAGIYGMNFEYMPELDDRYAYPLVLGAMLIIGAGMLGFFYLKGWFE